MALTIMKVRNYRTSIPAAATEIVEKRFDDGRAMSAYYYLDGDKVGYRTWGKTGALEFEYGMKDGKKHGREYCFFPDGQPEEMTPYRNGEIHGMGKQWTEGGDVVITYKLKNVAGLDLWCGHENRSLSEEQYWPKAGELGYRRNWNDDEASLNEEYYFFNGKGYHGIWRRWNSKGTLRRGYPHYYVNGSRVTKTQYLSACVQDESLPPYRNDEDRPFRELPREYVTQKGR